ncbi:DUF2079 domain-containing protein [Pigmentibacter sp. JX0631]|uniref:DUF2079 domain-containing protein n=1 Tax=Pigmentibacter sp. JX0631 TaxID=2976982 RepID=UPI002468C7F0|nr:DUF2079 domain-containing protein [Pigmentibacter sp. JX0631]WGL58909.1 DUF2079 domain-containing protein [Pigmentibacter sp. JX0631]
MSKNKAFNLNISKFSSFFKFSIAIVGILVIFAIVPNSFAISIVGAAFSFFWLLTNNKKITYFEKLREQSFFKFLTLWTCLVVTAGCIHAYLRYVSPGYDLSWFAQTITNATIGDGLRVTSEREITHLVQHWEPILFTATPLTLLFNGSISIVLWQGLAYIGGSIAAWKISKFLFNDSNLKSLKYLTTILFLLAWLNVNPLMFDAHPPVFGTLLIIPWIFYCIITKKSPFIIILLSLILMQCGEIFFAIAPVFIIYCLIQNKVTKLKIMLSLIIFFSGFLLVGAYQRYFGPFITGDPFFPFQNRYSSIGGDGIGILKTFFTDPLQVISKIFTINKLKTILKIFIYCGPFVFFALLSHKYRVIAVCLIFACLPYFIQAGLSPSMETNVHYVSSIGTIWWLLSVIGIYYLLYETKSNSKLLPFKKLIFNEQKLFPFFLILFFLNTSEWRKSLLYPFRAIVDRDNVNSEVRKYLTNIPREKGVIFVGSEWLCPLSADYRKWLLCEGIANKLFPKMPLDVVVANKPDLINFYNNLEPSLKNSIIGNTILALNNDNPEIVGWKKVGEYAQNSEPNTSKFKNILHFTIWEKIDSIDK